MDSAVVTLALAPTHGSLGLASRVGLQGKAKCLHGIVQFIVSFWCSLGWRQDWGQTHSAAEHQPFAWV